ncbi:hypothetical protein [Vibrio marisflavi]|uniref:Uncharacterized protein n=1 Tax=Vibrio marisflavi CECT 7928 TaxID=634439 RepID=A0ABN8E2M3_9VIBR|nr:hypothetical protein [Vibrio marisflavi]CAH0536016.1 hypothetical protein VMF7928_00112 [Vibrio marisflavi CECT 7928]
MTTVQQNTNAVQSTVGATGASGGLKTGDSNQKEIDNLINDLSSLAALVNKALQLIRQSIQDWRDALSNSQAKGMMLMLDQAVSNNAMQKAANQKECDAAYKASWGDFAKGCASMLGGFIGGGAAIRGTDAAQRGADVSMRVMDGAADFSKFWIARDAADITRDAKDKSADVQLQNKILDTWEKQIGQTGQRLGEMQGQLNSVNEQLRQSVSQLYYSLAQQ